MLHPLTKNVFSSRLVSTHWPSPLTHQDAARITQGLLLTSSRMAKSQKKPGGVRHRDTFGSFVKLTVRKTHRPRPSNREPAVRRVLRRLSAGSGGTACDRRHGRAIRWPLNSQRRGPGVGLLVRVDSFLDSNPRAPYVQVQHLPLGHHTDKVNIV